MTARTKAVEEVFKGVSFEALGGADSTLPVSSLEFSSRDCGEGSLFFCVPGTKADGHAYASDAVEHGACGLVVERRLDVAAPQFLVEDARKALALCSSNFYGRPSSKLKLVGITGTNGKTTTAFLTEHIAQVAGATTGLMGTVECHVGSEVRPSLHTTPESRDLQQLLSDMVDAGCDVAALEVSSHAIDLDRIAGTRFEVAAFTNLTQDHLDYHKTMENYFQAKARLFTDYAPQTSVVCIDNEYGARLADMVDQRGGKLLRVSSADTPGCDIRVVDAAYAPHSTDLSLVVQGAEVRFTLPLVGRFNVENCIVAFGIGLGLGYDLDTIVSALSSAPQVPGRLERIVGTDGTVPPFGVLVDYAHTPDSIAKAVAAVKAVTPGHVICVFGCGGDRDATKRPKMGHAALDADYAVVTSDNPRTEDPDKIIAQILPGMAGHEERYSVVPDRREAIRFALHRAQPGDAVLIAGKGHEDYQIIGTVKHHFDDREAATEELDAL